MAVAVGVEEGGVVTAAAAVQLHAQQAVGVEAEADGALGEARLEGADEALAPDFRVRGTILEITVEVGIAQQQGGVGVFDQTLGFGLLAGDGGKADGGGNRQRQGAQGVELHHGCS
ncbi:hypothetical protein D9M70_514750 [compost metagenome]